MKAEKIFTIASITTFFALLPALIIIQVKVLKMMPEITYLFIIMDILLAGFMVLELVLMIRKWKKEKNQLIEEEDEGAIKNVQIEQEWDEIENKDKQPEHTNDGRQDND
ncbi:MAG: hypothetical protein JXA54_11275 [Candidatus Heimdallarchaeota archaeon]|nr:hypothetical protein [Candidatus Heimdallarchaeota archaeon]